MAAPTQHTVGTLLELFSSGTSTLAVPAPATVSDNDIVLVFITGQSTITAATGFTNKVDIAAGTSRLSVWWKRRSPGDPAEPATYDFGRTASNTDNAVAISYSGAETIGDPFGTMTPNTSTLTATGTSTGNVSLVGVPANYLLVWAAGINYTTSQTLTAPSGFTLSAPTTGSHAIATGYEAWPTTGDTGNVAGTWGVSRTNRSAFLGALKPAGVTSTVAMTLPPVTSTFPIKSNPATLNSTLPPVTSSLLATVGSNIIVMSTLPPTSSLGATIGGSTINLTLPPVTSLLRGGVESRDTIGMTLPPVVSTFQAKINTAALTMPLLPVTSLLNVGLSVPTTIGITLLPVTSTFQVKSNPAQISMTLLPVVAALRGGVESRDTINITLLPVTISLAGQLARKPTWQEVVRSVEYLTAAQASTRRVSSRVEMVDDNELVVAGIPITGGTVSCDSTVDERWAATITLGDSDFMPSEVSDLLHPLSGLRARIWWTLELPSGLVAEVPIGTYYSSAPVATNNGSFGLNIKLLDVMSRIRRNKWGTGEVIDLGGMTVSAALRVAFTNRAPRLSAQITDTTDVLPVVYEVGQVGRDPLADILAIADAATFVVYSDRMGGIVAAPRGVVDNTRTVLDLSVGPDSRMESIQRSLDETQLLNTVTVRSSSTEIDPPVYATVQDNDPASPLWVGNGFIYSDVIDSDSVVTEDQCRALATVTLAERRALIEAVGVVHRSRPEIDPLNLLDINDPKTGASGVYELAAWAIDLAPGSMQRSTLTDRRVPV